MSTSMNTPERQTRSIFTQAGHVHSSQLHEPARAIGVNYSGDKFLTSCYLSPAEAREVASALVECADYWEGEGIRLAGRDAA